MSWNIFAFILATLYLFKLTNLLIDQESAFYSVMFLSFFPSSVFLTALYSESTFLFLVLYALYYLEKDQAPLATLLAVLAGLTRPEGFLVFIPFAYKALTVEKKKKIGLLLASCTIILTLPAFMLYGYILKGDPFISFRIERQWRKLSLLKMMAQMNFREIIGWFNGVHLISLITMVIAVLSVLTYFFSFKLTEHSFSIIKRVNRTDNKMPYYIWATLSLARARETVD